ncbi:MAG: preprotein translocase subunit SecA [Flavobacteriaceae bacterium]|nr:preprotein translocase subunit SecA [Flavobacteriaceae bacterium]
MNILNPILKLFVGDKQKKDLKLLRPIVDKVLSFGKELELISDDELRERTLNFKQKIQDASISLEAKITSLETEITEANVDRKELIFEEIDSLRTQIYDNSEKVLADIMPEAFAVIKETARRFTNNEEISVTASASDREFSSGSDFVSIEGDKAVWKNNWDASGNKIVWNMVHYDVQLIGGAVLHSGKIAEMMTGEGKTLVATLAIYLNALTEKGVHVITVNNYLAKRDAAWMGPLFQFHGMSIDCIDNHEPNSEARRKAYLSDITYGTNNEFGFDYLRDNMAHSKEELVQRKPNYAIIDEVDSVLVDDARTPLIISGPVPQGDRHEFNNLQPKVAGIVSKQSQFLISVFSQAKKLIQEGDTKEGAILLLRVYRGLPKNKALIKFLSQEGIKQLLQKTENNYMQDNNKEMHKIDCDLYFVIDEKNNSIELTEKGILEISDKDDMAFFVLPDISIKVADIDGNSELSTQEKTDQKTEIYKDFSIKSERIHTLNQLLKAYTLFEKDIEYVVMDNKVKIVDEQTGRIMDGRRYSDGLHQAIEAKESVKIEAATQTFATITLQNYFRMYPKLSGMTGTAITEAGEFWEIYKLDVIEIPTNKPLLRLDEDDLIFKTKREKYTAVINRIERLVEDKRPVLVGTTSVEISELLGKMLALKKIKHNVLNAKLHKKEADIVAEAGNAGVVTIATNMAGRGTDIKLSKEVIASGGLAIIGTERHDSRRVDRQLRGRSGRQGDVGSSLFYVSLEDNLMRLFGSDRLARIMDRMGLKEGEVIQNPMITRSIERAQKKVEENNFGIRKRLLEYDDIMNSQREVVYKRRSHALSGKRLQIDIANMIYDVSKTIIESNKSRNDFDGFQQDMILQTSIESSISEQDFNSKTTQELTDILYKSLSVSYKDKLEKNAKIAFPVIKEVYENQADRYERIVVPFTDGTKTIQVVTNLKDAYESGGSKLVQDFEKNITLSIVDENWKNHLYKMDELKQSVQNASYEQKDPLLIYKFEAFELFKAMLSDINREVLSFLFKGELPSQNANNVSEARTAKRQKLNTSKSDFEGSRVSKAHNTQERVPVETVVRTERKIGRNEQVNIQNISNGVSKKVKYKQAIPLIEDGSWVLID